MADNLILANGHVGWLAGPDSALSDSSWQSGPTKAELTTLINYSDGLKATSNFAVNNSTSVEDRSWADQAGAKARGYAQASGAVEPYTPGRGDTTSDIANAYNAFGTPRTKLALVQRFVTESTDALNSGDEISIFHVMTDDRKHNKTDASTSLASTLLLQDDLFINYIVPSTVPNPVTVTPSGALAVSMGTPKFLKASYEGRNVTVGAQWTSSDENIFKVTAHGVIVPIAAGTANLTVNLPGAAAGSAIAVTVS